MGGDEKHYMAKRRKDPAAVKLGRKGGRASVAVRTPEQQLALSRLGGKSRWKNHEPSQEPMAVYKREWRRRKKEQEQQKETE